MRLVKKFEPGGGLDDVADAASYMIPVYGTYRSIEDAYNEPSLTNIGMAGLSAIGDVGTLVGAGYALKGTVAGARAAKIAKATKALARANLASHSSLAFEATNKANKAYLTLFKEAHRGVPMSMWGLLQTYLRGLGLQVTMALKAALAARATKNATNINANLSIGEKAWEASAPYWRKAGFGVLTGTSGKAAGVLAKLLSK